MLLLSNYITIVNTIIATLPASKVKYNKLTVNFFFFFELQKKFMVFEIITKTCKEGRRLNLRIYFQISQQTVIFAVQKWFIFKD